MKYILASASPRRKELLAQAGFDFEVIPSTMEEIITKKEPSEIVMELAFSKAADVFEHLTENNCTVIGADTIVVYNGEILGKPEDEADAFNMLAMLSDRTHQVYTGVALISMEQGKKTSNVFYQRTDVTFYPVSRQDIARYVSTGDCLDKAGAYGIQGPFAIHVKEIHGDYNNVVGLPIARLYQELNKTSAPECKRLVFE